MATTLLTTKLYIPPVLPAFVPRPRLTERLSMGMAGKLTLITAPAGFGKTTAVSAWLDPQAEAGAGHPFVLHPERVGWVSLDEADNDATHFWAYVLAALKALVPEVGAIEPALLQSPQLSIEAVLTTLINALSGLSCEIVLVLDDYHVIVAPQIHHAIHFLLEHLPPRLHLLIMSRSAPPLPLSRLRGRGQLTELGATDLRFTPDEAAQFLTEVMHLRLSAAEMAALEARTEGWITGLHLATLAMRSRDDCAGFIRAFTGSNRFVLEYLADEVLARQPGHVQTFLQHTSILDRMCGSLCDAVLGIETEDLRPAGDSPQHVSSLKPPVSQAYSQVLLAELDRNNLFIVPLDDEQCWYRYHHLFVEVLRHRLGKSATPQEVARLHRRASRWFERQGLALEAVQHALAAEDWDRASSLIERHGLLIAVGGDVETVASWLTALPEPLIATHPVLGLLHASVQGMLNRPEIALARLQDVEMHMPSKPVSEQERLMQGWASLLRASLMRAHGNLRQSIALSQSALEILPETATFWHDIAQANLAQAFLSEPRAAPARPAPAPLRLGPEPTKTLFEPLTERELEVLRLVAAGTSNRAIAARLVVTLGTVKKHLHNIFGKLDVQSRTQALVRARELRLL